MKSANEIVFYLKWNKFWPEAISIVHHGGKVPIMTINYFIGCLRFVLLPFINQKQLISGVSWKTGLSSIVDISNQYELRRFYFAWVPRKWWKLTRKTRLFSTVYLFCTVWHSIDSISLSFLAQWKQISIHRDIIYQGFFFIIILNSKHILCGWRSPCDWIHFFLYIQNYVSRPAIVRNFNDFIFIEIELLLIRIFMRVMVVSKFDHFQFSIAHNIV